MKRKPLGGSRLLTSVLWLSVVLLALVAVGGWLVANFDLQTRLNHLLTIGALVLSIVVSLLVLLQLGMAARSGHGRTDGMTTTSPQPALADSLLTPDQQPENNHRRLDGDLVVQPAAATRVSSATSTESKPDTLLDELTKLPSRPWFERTLRSEISRSRRYRHPLALVVITVDQYASVRRDHGDALADYTLITAARALRSIVRLSDHIGRIRENEFVVILTETGSTGARIVGEKIRRAMELYPFDEDLEVTVSVSVAALTESDTLESILSRGEHGAMEARKRGGNRLVAVNLKNHT